MSWTELLKQFGKGENESESEKVFFWKCIFDAKLILSVF